MTLPPEYLTFWITVGAIVLGWISLNILGGVWLVCALVVIGGMRDRTLKRVLVALLLGPLLLRDRGFST